MAAQDLKKQDSKFFDEPIEFGKPIVTKGRIFAFPLKSSIRQSLIEKGNCVSIVWDNKGSIFYGLVIGKDSHIFLLDSNSTVEDVGRIDVKNPINGALVYDDKDTIVCIITDENSIKIFTYNLGIVRRMYSHMWGHFSCDTINNTNAHLHDEVFYAAIKSDFDDLFYILTAKGNIYSLVIKNNEINLIQTVDNKNLSRVLCSNTLNGDIYGVNREGNFWRLNNKKEIHYLDAKIPCMKNRDYVASASKLLWKFNKIYGCTLQDAYLFEFDPSSNIIKSFGRPDENFEVRDIDILEDGRIFGITANKNRGMGRIFCYSDKFGFQDIGIIQAWQSTQDFAYEPLCIKSGASGDFLIGNGENRSNIFLFCSYPA